MSTKCVYIKHIKYQYLQHTTTTFPCISHCTGLSNKMMIMQETFVTSLTFQVTNQLSVVKEFKQSTVRAFNDDEFPTLSNANED
jgi:hypothetical protein